MKTQHLATNVELHISGRTVVFGDDPELRAVCGAVG